MTQDPRERFIATVATGHSFIDVGGLYGIVRERISSAHRAGARSLTLLDMENEDCPWWAEMKAHLDANAVGPCSFRSGDLMTTDVEPFDVVHSSGMLYHMPSPIAYIQKLRSMTSKFCILTSTTINTRVSSAAGELTIADGTTVFVPALAGSTRDIIAGWFRDRGYGEIAEAAELFGVVNYYRNWFIPTVTAFKAMAVCGGFEIIDEAPIDADHCAYALLLRPAVNAPGG